MGKVTNHRQCPSPWCTCTEEEPWNRTWNSAINSLTQAKITPFSECNIIAEFTCYWFSTLRIASWIRRMVSKYSILASILSRARARNAISPFLVRKSRSIRAYPAQTPSSKALAAMIPACLLSPNLCKNSKRQIRFRLKKNIYMTISSKIAWACASSNTKLHYTRG